MHLTTDLDAILEPVTAHIWRFKGQCYWGEEVNCYLVEDDGQLVLIDAPNHSPVVRKAVFSRGLSTRLYLTHGASSGDGALWQEIDRVPMCLHELDRTNRWLRGEPDVFFAADLQVTTHLRAMHSPDHSPGHTMYIDDRDGGSLFTGDGLLFRSGCWKIEMSPEARTKLEKLQVRRVLPYHYDPVLGQTRDRIDLIDLLLRHGGA